jgi:hypothetical protein
MNCFTPAEKIHFQSTKVIAASLDNEFRLIPRLSPSEVGSQKDLFQSFVIFPRGLANAAHSTPAQTRNRIDLNAILTRPPRVLFLDTHKAQAVYRKETLLMQATTVTTSRDTQLRRTRPQTVVTV